MTSDFTLILLSIGFEFIVYRILLILICHLFTYIFKKDKHFYHEKELFVSILMYLLFTFIYFRTMVKLIPSLHDAYLDVYLLMTIYGIFAVLWAYLSWDMDHWFRPISFAENKDVIIKKGVIFTVVLIGVFVFGYYQTLTYTNKEILNPLLSITNISVFAIIIAFDRVINQIYLHHNSKNHK